MMCHERQWPKHNNGRVEKVKPKCAGIEMVLSWDFHTLPATRRCGTSTTTICFFSRLYLNSIENLFIAYASRDPHTHNRIHFEASLKQSAVVKGLPRTKE